MDDVNTPQKIVQMQFPITWLLSSVAGIVIAVGTLIFQINSATSGITELKSSMQELKTAQSSRDDRMTLISASSLEIRSQFNDLQRQISRVSEDMSEVRKDNNYRRSQQR